MVINYSPIEDKHNEFDISKLLVPAKDHLPKWYSEMKADYYSPNVRTCASFVELFNNSLLFVSPGKWWLDFNEQGFNSDGDDVSKTHIGLSSHTFGEGTDQLGDFDKGFHNIKIDVNFIIKSTLGRYDAIYMDTFYWNTRPRFRAAQGILPILDNKEVQPNVNIWVPKMIDRLEFNTGDTIALLYFPMGTPELKRGEVLITEREREGGDYIAKMRKCPYGYE